MRLQHTSSPSNIYVRMSPIQQLLLFGVLAALAALVVVTSIQIGPAGNGPLLMAFLAYLILLVLPLLLERQKLSWFHPLVFFIAFWLLARGMLPRLGVFATGLDQHIALPGWTSTELDTIVVKGTVLEGLALIVTLLGFYGAPRLRTYRISFSPPRLVSFKILGVAAISIGAFVVLAKLAGGLGPLLLQRGLPETLRIEAEVGGAHWQVLVGILIPACLVWLALKPQVWYRPHFWMLFVVALVLEFAATGSRSGLIVPMLMALAIWMLQHQRVPYGRGLAIVVLGLIVVGVLGEFRAETRGADSLRDVDVQAGFGEGFSLGAETISAAKSTREGQYGILGKVPDDISLLYGRSYLSVPAAPIPRILWPDKPEAGGKLTSSQIFGKPLSAMPPGSVGEAYWNFHIPGIVVVFLLWGVFLKWLARMYALNVDESSATVLLVVTLFYLQPDTSAFYNWVHAISATVFLLCVFCGLPRVRRNG